MDRATLAVVSDLAHRALEAANNLIGAAETIRGLRAAGVTSPRDHEFLNRPAYCVAKLSFEIYHQQKRNEVLEYLRANSAATAHAQVFRHLDHLFSAVVRSLALVDDRLLMIGVYEELPDLALFREAMPAGGERLIESLADTSMMQADEAHEAISVEFAKAASYLCEGEDTDDQTTTKQRRERIAKDERHRLVDEWELAKVEEGRSKEEFCRRKGIELKTLESSIKAVNRNMTKRDS